MESTVAKTTVLLSLLAGCKQSKHPYLAFEAVAPPSLNRHPSLVGAGRASIDRHPNDETLISYRPTPMARVLALTEDPMVIEPPRVTTISRAQAKAKEFELSGEEPHNALVTPLIKPADAYSAYWQEKWNPQAAAPTLVGRLALPVAIVDAPLLLVRGGPGKSETIPANWLRLISHRAVSGERDPWKGKSFDVVDIVHATFVDQFLDAYATPYVRRYYERFGHIHAVLVAGRATVRGWTSGKFPEDLLKRLAPRAR